MTKKDYELIEEAFKYCKPLSGLKYEQWFATISHFSLIFKDNNPKFDQMKFLAACGIQSSQAEVERIENELLGH